jgi:ZIP family zinc transporter
MGAAIAWGSLASFSLVLGAALALIRPWPKQVVGLILAFGAGALISAVSFELAEEGIKLGAHAATAIGLGAGALTYYFLNGLVERRGAARAGNRAAGAGGGTALALGAFLDGIPEQMVLGMSLAAGGGVSVGLLVAIFLSNLPEAIGSASAMQKSGRGGRDIMRLWIGVAVICLAGSIVGYALADSVGSSFEAGLDGFAAGALIVMLVDAMIPEARESGGEVAGLVTTLGFALGAGLSFAA